MRCLFLPLLLSVTSLVAAKPNILVIYSDDHGWADLGSQGVNGDIRTPHLDALAKQGVRCSRGYVSAPQCVPSRAGVMTGRYQQRFGVEDNTKGALPLAERTIAERLKPAGYVTGQVGKWHLDLRKEVGGDGKKDRSAIPAHMPHGQGFDEYWRGELRNFIASHDLQSRPFADAPHMVEDKRFRVSVQTDAALAFLHRREAQPTHPWFLYLAYFTPHVPLESPEPWFSKVPAHLPKERRQALAMIAAMDEGIGAIRAKLQAMGQLENTLIFFIADNGAPTKEGHWDGSLNAPLIGEKGMLTDGGVRVPFLVSWPGTLPQGTVYEQPVINLDVAATACAITEQPSDGLDGVNLIPFLKGDVTTPPHERLFWRWRSQAAVLEFPWKLIRLGPNERFLFDVSKPEGEKVNLIMQHPDIEQRLQASLTQWSSELQPPGLPTTDNDQDRIFFGEHVDPRFAPPQPKAKDAPGSVQGWLARNGSLSIKDGALHITRDASVTQPVFLTKAPLDFLGPATLAIRCRTKQGGTGRATWRIRHQTDFEKDASVAFEWPTTSEWKDVSVKLPPTSRLIHLRIYTPEEGEGIEIQSIQLQRKGQPPEAWDFKKPTASAPAKIGPWDIHRLQQTVPTMRWLDQTQPVHSLIYQGERYEDHDTEVFAFYASPATLGKGKPGERYPGVVCIHGGGGTAFHEWVTLWAERGYAAISMDLAGMQPPPLGSPLSPHKAEGRTRLAKGGPDQGGPQKFGSIGGTHDDDWPYHAAASAILAHSLLRSFPEVDAERTAVTGISWGGYTTCLVASLDDRFKAAVPVYGCGFLRDGDSVQRPSIDQLGDRADEWVRTYDPGSLLPHCRVPILFVNGSHDKHYPLDSWTRSYAAVPGEKHTRIEFKGKHSHPDGWKPAEIGLFIDSKCRAGIPLPEVKTITRTSDEVHVQCTTRTALKEAQLHFTTATGLREKREWQALPARIEGTQAISPAPPREANTWFITITDERNAMISTPAQFAQ